jgi:tetratricopeptide (TPR) repeat protein
VAGSRHILLQQPDLAIREFKRAIRLSKADELTGKRWDYSSYSKQRQAILWLAETYEAVGRTKDAKEQYLLAKAAHLDLREAQKALVEKAGSDRIWRSEGRTRVTLARILEWLGEIDAARDELALAVKVFDVTTYVEDDEFEKSEHEDALKELERISQDPVAPCAPLTEREAMFRLQRDLIFTRRSNLAVHGWDSKPPRYRV